jgi:hypothetical protein
MGFRPVRPIRSWGEFAALSVQSDENELLLRGELGVSEDGPLK